MNQWIRKTDAADHMREVTKSGVTYLTFPILDATGIVIHAFSTRMGGVSEGWYSTMNFSFTRGDDPVSYTHLRVNDAHSREEADCCKRPRNQSASSV